MAKVKELIKFFRYYDPEAEVILPNGEEINHVGMARINLDGYCVILANNKNNRIH